MKEVKPQFRNLCNKSDLEKMNVGDFTNCKIEEFLSKINLRNGIVVYEGVIDDMDSFIAQYPENAYVVGLRIQRGCLRFNNGIILNSKFITPVIYKEDSSRYKDAKRLLINANLWREVK